MFRFVFICLLILPSFISAQNSYTFGDRVNVRQEPELSSGKVCQLPAGHPLKILRNTETPDTLMNRIDPWYEVEFDWKGKRERGWIWGGLLTMDHQTLPDGSLTLMGFRVDDEDNVMHRLIILNAGQTLLDKEIPSGYDGQDVREYGGVSYTCFTDIGIRGVQCVFLLGAELSPCGYSADFSAYAWTGNELLHVVDYDEYGSEYEEDQSGELIFPTDSVGRAGQIGFHRWLHDWNPEEERDVILEETYTWYTFSGKVFVPGKE